MLTPQKPALEDLLDSLHQRLPDFAMDIHTFGHGMPVMVQWRFRMGHPMWQWKYRTPGEMMNGGSFPNVRAAVEHIHAQCDRFEASEGAATAVAKEKATRQHARLHAAAASARRPLAPAQDEPAAPEPKEPRVRAEPVPTSASSGPLPLP